MVTQDQNAAKKSLTPTEAVRQAAMLSDQGRLHDAEKLCNMVLNAAPDFHPAHFQLAVIAAHVGKMDIAADLAQKAITLSPQTGQYHRAQTEICRRLGRLNAALAAGKTATSLLPDDAEAFYNYGLALMDAGQGTQAISAYRRALDLNPQHNLCANNLGVAYEAGGDMQNARQCYEQAIAINPGHAEARNNLGAILSADGDIEQAKTHFAAALDADPYFVHAHYNLSTLKRYTADDPHFKMLQQIEPHIHRRPANDQMHYYFARGKACEDTGDFDAAFAAFKQGNDLKRQSYDYDSDLYKNVVGRIIKTYDTTLADTACKACDDPSPVFILGMPRSGSTLIEQILSSHPAIYGAGELNALGDALDTIAGTSLATYGNYTGWMTDHLETDALQKLGEDYVARLRAIDADTPLICDKMPANFFFIGLIHKALPQAKIIHTSRDPLDTCISNYTRLFNNTMNFAYDLTELGRYYHQYDRMMQHWGAVLPAGTIHHVRYEDVLDDLEGQARELIAYCGLDWDEACLDFHRNKRPVKTASIAQVRQPLYTSSKARWKRYDAYLEPLKTAIQNG